MLTDRTKSILRAMSKQSKIDAVNNTDEQALQVQSLYPDWETIPDGETLKLGQRVNYNGVLYNIIQEHQKQSIYNPVDANYLYSKVLIPDPSVIPEWEQPDYTNPYMKGDKVKHNGKTWESLIDNNSWEPGAAGTETLWIEVVE